jgi:transposase-like protein
MLWTFRPLKRFHPGQLDSQHLPEQKKNGGKCLILSGRCTTEYRREALLLADKVGVAAAAKQLGLHESQFHGWRGKDSLERSQSGAEKWQALEIVRLKPQLAEKTKNLAILKKRQCTLPKGLEEATTAKYAFMIEVYGEFTETALCRALDVSPSALHAWRHRREQGDAIMARTMLR